MRRKNLLRPQTESVRRVMQERTRTPLALPLARTVLQDSTRTMRLPLARPVQKAGTPCTMPQARVTNVHLANTRLRVRKNIVTTALMERGPKEQVEKRIALRSQHRTQLHTQLHTQRHSQRHTQRHTQLHTQCHTQRHTQRRPQHCTKNLFWKSCLITFPPNRATTQWMF